MIPNTSVDSIHVFTRKLKHQMMPRFSVRSIVSVGGRKKAVDPGWQNRHTQVFAKIAIQLVDTDSQLGNLVIQGLQTWKRGEAMMEEEIRYQNLTQYLSDRLVDNAFEFLFAVARFGSNFSLTKEEEKLIEPVLKPYYEIMILTNDYFSWETEYTTFLRSNEKVVVRNAVPLFMEWYSMSCQEAKVALKEKIKSLEDDYCSLKAEFFSQYQIPGSSPAIMRWFEILEGVLAGNIFWSKTCPRFNTAFGSEYKQYLAQRINEGAYFFNSSTESSAIISNNILKISKLNLSGQGVTDSECGMGPMGRMKPSLFTCERLPPLDQSVIEYPSRYIASLPSKEIWHTFIDALNTWYQVPQHHLSIIRTVITQLHSSSLMLDDIQDHSPLRGGNPAAHRVYGIGQTVNSAYFQCADALRQIQKISSDSVLVFTEELMALQIGQGADMYWTYHSITPTEEEYLQTVDSKTTALFRMASRLLQGQATMNRCMDMEGFLTLFGRYIQIRNDYQNLASSENTKNQGFCSDFDGGKYSLPLIHASKHGSPEINAILQQRKRTESLTTDLKIVLLSELKAKGSLAYTLQVLQNLERAIKDELQSLESEAEIKNWLLWRILQQMSLDNHHG
ncbi:unnamed protein product [Alternaria alternata]